MHRMITLSLSLSLLFTGAAMAQTAAAMSPPGAQAKVSMTKARQIALKAYPGTINKQELEKESGGSGLRYSFDIRATKGTHEVGVDAATGKVLENSVEGKDND